MLTDCHDSQSVFARYKPFVLSKVCNLRKLMLRISLLRFRIKIFSVLLMNIGVNAHKRSLLFNPESVNIFALYFVRVKCRH